MIEGIQRMITSSSQGEELLTRMNPAIRRHFELEIKTLQNAPRDVDKLERLLQVKERQKEGEAMYRIRAANPSINKYLSLSLFSPKHYVKSVLCTMYSFTFHWVIIWCVEWTTLGLKTSLNFLHA
jgi:hypothetical protein